MAFKSKKLISNRRNYGSKRNTSLIKYLVYHYTANDGDTDEANAKYFHNNIVKASAHRFVDDDSVTISVLDNYVAWHCGGGLQGSKGHTYYKTCTNTNSIGIEMCDTKRNGKYEVTEKTRSNAIALGKELVKKYGIKKENVIRHYDVTGKNCPAYFVKDEEAWIKFRNEIFESENKEFKTYYIKVNTKSLNVREGAGTQYKVIKTIKKDEKWLIRDEKNGWGKIRIGWIKLSYTKKV